MIPLYVLLEGALKMMHQPCAGNQHRGNHNKAGELVLLGRGHVMHVGSIMHVPASLLLFADSVAHVFAWIGCGWTRVELKLVLDSM